MNLTGDPSHDYFIDGFTEELIAQLGHRGADRAGVLVTPRQCSTRMPGAAPPIGELRVDYLVEGSVRVGGNVRITAQLIETRGETHRAHSYDRENNNCLSVQTEVAAEIAVALTGELFRRRRTMRRPGVPRRLRGDSPAASIGTARVPGIQTAIAFYDQALGHDPGFGRAHSARARAPCRSRSTTPAATRCARPATGPDGPWRSTPTTPTRGW